ncbi:uncharacterized membrane protein HdeD (DUF308 family) [Nocardioides aromaticivorans]|uniref:Uncharacterized membrane protein HdeD (DUF308 family) n=1 Tax=Nocardioides aromaticivorans TaxID=200618 RepID=A0A7Y9ZJ10_9ACTN|nr:hypothetical protein [Nocardioides aromaticivorans]NYI45288.1 uncharacterized membrane protein HdeD (DUF308 family) [Nocardioides aromaticivorans]
MTAAPTTTSPTIGAEAGRARQALRALYGVRFGFALAWAAALLLATRDGSDVTTTVAVLLVAYPLFDLAAAVVDHRASGGIRAGGLLRVNMALSGLAAAGLAVAAASGAPAVLRTWGAWAIAAGAVQLVVALRRRGLGGQWPMILSGGISVLAGGGFVATAAGSDPALGGLGGYALLGGIFFLASAVRLSRTRQRP